MLQDGHRRRCRQERHRRRNISKQAAVTYVARAHVGVTRFTPFAMSRTLIRYESRSHHGGGGKYALMMVTAVIGQYTIATATSFTTPRLMANAYETGRISRMGAAHHCLMAYVSPCLRRTKSTTSSVLRYHQYVLDTMRLLRHGLLPPSADWLSSIAASRAYAFAYVVMAMTLLLLVRARCLNTPRRVRVFVTHHAQELPRWKKCCCYGGHIAALRKTPRRSLPQESRQKESPVGVAMRLESCLTRNISLCRREHVSAPDVMLATHCNDELLLLALRIAIG